MCDAASLLRPFRRDRNQDVCRYARLATPVNYLRGIPEKIAQLYRQRYLPWANWMRDQASLFQLCSGWGRQYTVPRRIDSCTCGCKRIWRAQPHLQLVLSIAVYGLGVEAAAASYRMRRPRALRLLRLGLDRYLEFG